MGSVLGHNWGPGHGLLALKVPLCSTFAKPTRGLEARTPSLRARREASGDFGQNLVGRLRITVARTPVAGAFLANHQPLTYLKQIE